MSKEPTGFHILVDRPVMGLGNVFGLNARLKAIDEFLHATLGKNACMRESNDGVPYRRGMSHASRQRKSKIRTTKEYVYLVLILRKERDALTHHFLPALIKDDIVFEDE
jgi:hypothetical protein